MRKFILGAIIWGIMGAVLSSKGIDFTTWQFWAMFALVLADSINDKA